MFRKTGRKGKQRSRPDHLPMNPEFREQGDTLNESVHRRRVRYDELSPNRYLNWR